MISASKPVRNRLRVGLALVTAVTSGPIVIITVRTTQEAFHHQSPIEVILLALFTAVTAADDCPSRPIDGDVPAPTATANRPRLPRASESAGAGSAGLTYFLM
jgi:hypothetical protein